MCMVLNLLKRVENSDADHLFQERERMVSAHPRGIAFPEFVAQVAG